MSAINQSARAFPGLDHAITLGVLLLATYVVTRSGVGTGMGRLTMYVGLTLLAATVAGRWALGMGLPRLTGFLLIGFVLGPSAFGLMSPEVIADLRMIDRFALALIGLLAGGELQVRRLGEARAAIISTTLIVTAMVAVGVTGFLLVARPLLPFMAGVGLAGAGGLALLLGVWAANSSPDLAVAVIEDMGAKGPLTDVILGVTIVKDIIVIVLFTIVLAIVSPLIDPASAGGHNPFLEVTREVGGAVVVGGLLGWLFSLYLEASDERRSPLATFLFTYILVVIAEALNLELLILAASAGFLIENLSPAGDRMIRGIASVSVVVFAFFFAIAGASLDLGAVADFWLVASLFFGVRMLLTIGGARVATRLAGASELIQDHTGSGLISQGGVTLGLLLLIEAALPSVGDGVVALGTAVVIANILVGPIILKRALSSEVSR
ncbi:MAG: cation:proton antiporter [Gemmatimonadota bacterium]|nr:MAG: cation:proton antiporter [Gemmatimonadota bacterium]